MGRGKAKGRPHWRASRYKRETQDPRAARKAQDPDYRRFKVPGGNSFHAAYWELAFERGTTFSDPGSGTTSETGGRDRTITRHTILGRMREKKLAAYALKVNGPDWAAECAAAIERLKEQALAEGWTEDDLYQETMRALHAWGQLDEP